MAEQWSLWTLHTIVGLFCRSVENRSNGCLEVRIIGHWSNFYRIIFNFFLPFPFSLLLFLLKAAWNCHEITITWMFNWIIPKKGFFFASCWRTRTLRLSLERALLLLLLVLLLFFTKCPFEGHHLDEWPSLRHLRVLSWEPGFQSQPGGIFSCLTRWWKETIQLSVRANFCP